MTDTVAARELPPASIDAAAQGPRPALVVCHRGSIRLALAALHEDDAHRSAAIPNASLVELP